MFCSTTNADLITAIESIADFSFITFGGDDAGECVRIGNSTQSFYIPAALGPDDEDDDDDDDDDD